MSYLLEILGRGLLSELAAAFRSLLYDDGLASAKDLEAAVEGDPEGAEHHRRLAVRMLADRQYGRARTEFVETLRLEPTDRVARIGLACTFDELGQTRAAVAQLQEYVHGGAEDGPTFFALGFCQEKLGETEEAITSYESTLDIAPNIRNAHERLAAIYLKRDDVGMAIAHYEHLCFCEPGDINAAITLANLYCRAGRHEDAVRRYQSAITVDPDNWEAQDDLVAAQISAGKYDEALATLKGLIAQRPECADQYLRLGDLHTKAGDENAALSAYGQAVALNPDYLEAMIKVGTANLRRGCYVESAQAFSRAIEINDRIVTAYVGMAVAQQAMGKTEDAQASVEMASGIEPNSTLLFSEMARLQLKVSAAQQAKRYASPEAVAGAPDGPRDPEVAAIMEQQIARLRAVVREHPNHADLHYRLGLLLRHNGDLGGAIESFLQAVTINPQYLKAIIKLAFALREAGRPEAAIEVAQRALSIDPQSIDLHYQLGLMFADKNQFALALDRFDHAVREAPQNLDYVANLALALQNMGLMDRAAEAWRTLCDLAQAAPAERRLFTRASRFAT